jgi:hypothetical protein
MKVGGWCKYLIDASLKYLKRLVEQNVLFEDKGLT